MNSLYAKFPFYVPKPVKEEEQDNFAKMYLPSSTHNGEDMEIAAHIDALLKEELKVICSIIEQDTTTKIAQQYGHTITSYGATRILATKFLTHIISLGSTEYAFQLAICLPSLLKHCVDYPWNSFLHNNVEKIFDELFKKNSKYPDDIRTAVIAETNLADYIADIEVNVQMPESGRYVRNGVIATFVNIANMLKNHGSEYVQIELNKSGKWLDFVDTVLASSNENNEQALAGHQSKTDDSDVSNYETSMDKLFAHFTSLKESHDSSRGSDEEDEGVDLVDSLLAELKLQEASHKAKLDLDRLSKEETKQKDKESKKKVKKSKKDKKDKTEVDKENGSAVPGETSNPQEVSSEEAETAKPVQAKKKDDVEESNTFYDNSYWSLGSGFKLEDLLQDC